MNNIFNQKANFPEVKIEGENQIVSAKELHTFLGTETDFSHWIKRMLEYGFADGVDFTTFLTEIAFTSGSG